MPQGKMKELRKEGLLACRDLAADGSGFALRMFTKVREAERPGLAQQVIQLAGSW